MSSKLAKIATVTFLAFSCILWSQLPGRLAHGTTVIQPQAAFQGLLGKRAELSNLSAVECEPILYPPSQQCAHIREACPESKTVLGLPHLQAYFCAEPKLRPVVFIGLLAWLALLFSTIGIGASDFFCPNLATIATVLGLDENVAGVTFLAFGNGSPDVFSTFSAMKSNSGSLAIGELLGAASFIVSVVVGSMCIIKPFHVHRGPFLRDVGFFTVAVSMMLWILYDGILQAWEAGALVALYLTYVTIVVLGTWWETRQEKRRQANLIIRQEYLDETPPDYEPYRDDPTPLETPSISLTVPIHTRGRAQSNPNPPRSPPDLPQRPRSRSPPQSQLQVSPRPSSSLQHLPSFSLLRALEFRDVVASLQHQSSAMTLSAFEAPLTPFTGRSIRSRVSSVGTLRDEINPFDEALERQFNLDRLRTEGSPDIGPSEAATGLNGHAHILSTSTADDELHYRPPTFWQRIQHTIYRISQIIFPHLHNFSHKSIASIFVGIFATPGVLALTLTIPVVTTSMEEGVHLRSPVDDTINTHLLDFEEDGVERVLVAEDELKDELYGGAYHKWLTAFQCAIGPIFCVSMVMGMGHNMFWYLIGAAVTGVSTAALVLIFSDHGNNAAGRLARCFMGFIISIVWIMTIADEVVGVLKTFGLIFGLSDAIIGLTVFAIGNSLADLVANTSVAKFAPIMGFSACFGGPMLNILLGVGVSGSVVIEENGSPYDLKSSPTLLVSAVSLLLMLLCTLVWLPYNGYFLSRTWGFFLIAFYTCTMVVALVVEQRYK
ncbi:hypothetical protein M422DRAFT_26210 [Sphaerobolus stellatus SS14]|nr:hypothetical protein M422DRAFT_26210 [Sphaerobolus stellatus SS14]